MGFAHCEWGLAGIEAWRDQAGVLVIVDVLSFSTAVSVAVEQGAQILPFPLGDKAAAEAAAAEAGALLAQPRHAAGGQYTLSPASLARLPAGTRLMLPSPNGSRLSLAGGASPVLAGCLRNPTAVAKAAEAVSPEKPIVVIAAGERWPDGSLRPAIEDWLGAGAILNALTRTLTAEARVARDAFRAVGDDLADLIRASLSGQELIDRGFDGDVEIALALNQSAAVPRLIDGVYVAAAHRPIA